ncbi:hypothetical protein HaLaN_18634, partial [Haematococcus lacustris]
MAGDTTQWWLYTMVALHIVQLHNGGWVRQQAAGSRRTWGMLGEGGAMGRRTQGRSGQLWVQLLVLVSGSPLAVGLWVSGSCKGGCGMSEELRLRLWLYSTCSSLGGVLSPGRTRLLVWAGHQGGKSGARKVGCRVRKGPGCSRAVRLHNWGSASRWPGCPGIGKSRSACSQAASTDASEGRLAGHLAADADSGDEAAGNEEEGLTGDSNGRQAAQRLPGDVSGVGAGRRVECFDQYDPAVVAATKARLLADAEKRAAAAGGGDGTGEE